MNALDARLRDLQRRFLARSAGDLTQLKAGLQSGDLQALRPLVHRLSGAAGTFGHHELSRVAGEADDALIEQRSDSRAVLEALLQCLQATLATPQPD